MDSCCFRNPELWNPLLKKVFLAISISVMCMGAVHILIGGLALSNMSKINTDHIKPLMDTITVDAIEPLVLLISVGVIEILQIVPVVVVIFCNASIKKALITYAVFILVLIILEIIVTLLWFITEDTVKNKMKSKMVLALNQFNADETTNSNSVSNAWNFLFMTLNCCGVNAVKSTTNDFDATPWCTTSGSCQATSSQIPKTCCLNVNENTYTSAPSGCHASVNPGTYNTKGCYDALKETLLADSSSVIAGVSISILEVFALVIGVILFWRYFKKVYPFG